MSDKKAAPKAQAEEGSEAILQILRDDIISNKYHPGEHLVERDIALQYNVSRTPVRDALKQLENDGLVKRVPNKGVFVTSLSLAEVREVYETRSVLEAYASRLAVNRMTDEQVQRQMELVELAAQSVRDMDYNQAHLYDQEFHHNFFRICGNSRIYAMINDLWIFVLRLRRVAFLVPGRSQNTVLEHQQIMDAVQLRDADAVETLVRMHVLKAMNTLIDNARKGLINL